MLEDDIIPKVNNTRQRKKTSSGTKDVFLDPFCIYDTKVAPSPKKTEKQKTVYNLKKMSNLNDYGPTILNVDFKSETLHSNSPTIKVSSCRSINRNPTKCNKTLKTTPPKTIPKTTSTKTTSPKTTSPKTTTPKTTSPKTIPKTTSPKTTSPKTSSPETTSPETIPKTTSPETTSPETIPKTTLGARSRARNSNLNNTKDTYRIKVINATDIPTGHSDQK